MLLVYGSRRTRYMTSQMLRLTACVSRKWAGRENAWKRDSAEALKTAKKRGDSHSSAARCVGRKVSAYKNSVFIT